MTREESIFAEALGKGSGAERDAYLEEACASDAGLRHAVAALLRAHEQAGGILESPPTGLDVTIDTPPSSHSVGSSIGPYKLLEQIGGGGMGVVYMAEQVRPVRRKVALKIIKPGMDSGQVIARFEAERQALTMMDHPNIARVLDAGTTDAGRPYFVMELVKGVPITDYCDQARLDPRQRLDLFVQVCNAVQHAHQKGVIHRDLKPGNVLVTLHDDRPVPKVIDFGIAKATGQQLTERTLFTNYAQMLGTPLYMSPEQAQFSGLDVDTRSDVYSLGVLLYELLTGTTPFDKQRLREAAYDEMRRIIREEDPPKPSTRISTLGNRIASISALRDTEPRKLGQLVRGELDWIVMKSLEKDRTRRYETAIGLGRDVERYLADEPVQACPPSAVYRFRKAARRNKAALATAGLILLICLTLTGGIGWNLRDRAARQTAVDREVNLALDEAEQLQARAKWSEALAAVRRAEGLVAAGGGSELRGRVQQLRRNMEMVLRLEEIPLVVSEWKVDRFDHEAAERGYAKVFADYGMDVDNLPVEEAAALLRTKGEFAVALVTALDYWANNRSQRDPAGATRLRSVAQAADPDPWRRQVREAIRRKDRKGLAALASSPELLRQPPITLLVLAGAYRTRGDVEGEIRMLRQAQRQYPGDFWINFNLAWALGQSTQPSHTEEALSFLRAATAVRPQNGAVHTNLGGALIGQGKLDEAVAVLRKAVELDPNNPRPHTGLAVVLYRQKKLPEAIAACRRAIELDPNESMAYNNLAGALLDQKKLPEGLAALHKAIELDPKHTLAYSNLGHVLREQGKPDEAVAAYRKAIEFNPKSAKIRVEFGNALWDGGMREDAIAAYREAIEIDPKYAHAYCTLGGALISQRKLAEGEAACRSAIEVDPKHTCAYGNLGLALQKQGKVDEAIAWSRKAIEFDPKDANAHNTLGIALQGQGKLDDAAACYRQAIALDPKHANAHSNLGNALSDQQKPDEALAWYRKAIEINPKHVNAHTSLGTMFYQQGKLDEAIAWYHKALEIDPKDAGAQYGVGIVLKAQGNLEEAITWFRKVIETDPKHANAHTALANSLKAQIIVRSQHFRKAKDAAGCRASAEMLEKLKRTDPNSLFDAACLRAVTAEAVGKDPTTPAADAVRLAEEEADRAMAWLEQAVAAGYSDVEHMKRDGALQVLRGRADYQRLVAELERKRSAATESALEDNARLLRAQPGDGALLASRASLLVQLNRHGEAEAAYRAAIRVSPQDASLHHALGDVLLKLAKPADAAVAYAEAIRLRPGEHASYYGLGSASAAGGDWAGAAAAFRQAAELKPNDLPTLFKTAAVSLYTDDVETHRRACQALVQRFGATDNIQVADCTIKACALAPGFGADAQKVIDLANAPVFQAQTGPAREWFEIARALVELRAGRFESAATIVERSTPSHDIHRDASALAILAMARHHLGKADEARAALSHAQGVISTKMPKVEAGETFGDDWHDWLHAQILCREAEKLLAVPKTP